MQILESGKFFSWNPESSKFLPVQSRILGFGIRTTTLGIRNPTYDGIWNPSSADKIWDPVYGIRNPHCGIQNPRLPGQMGSSSCLPLARPFFLAPSTSARPLRWVHWGGRDLCSLFLKRFWRFGIS